MNELEQRVAKLEAIITSLRNTSTIPFDIDAAFGDRFSLGGVPSTKTAASETDTFVKTVNFGGSSVTTGTGAKAMDGFILIGGRNIPYYD